MKIQFTQYRKLDALEKTVQPGDTLQSPEVPDELMQAYIRNGIAVDVSPGMQQINLQEVKDDVG